MKRDANIPTNAEGPTSGPTNAEGPTSGPTNGPTNAEANGDGRANAEGPVNAEGPTNGNSVINVEKNARAPVFSVYFNKRFINIYEEDCVYKKTINDETDNKRGNRELPQ